MFYYLLLFLNFLFVFLNFNSHDCNRHDFVQTNLKRIKIDQSTLQFSQLNDKINTEKNNNPKESRKKL